MVGNAAIAAFDAVGTIGFLYAAGIGIQNYRNEEVERLFWLAFAFTAGGGGVWMALLTIEWIGISSALMDQFTTALQAVVIGLFAVGVIGTNLVVRDLKQSRSETVRQASIVAVLSRVLRHNLRNDLNVVRGHLNHFLEDLPGDHPLAETAVDKIDYLIELAETGRQVESITSSEHDRRAVELNELVENVIGQVAPNYPSASFTIDGPDELVVEAVPTLRTALEELIENAAKHGGEQPNVTVSIDSTSDSVSVAVIDNGPGLPEEEREVLEAGSESPLVHGSGLGLWLTYWIVSDHDGSIDTDVTDDGTRVAITIPRTSTLTEPEPTEPLLNKFYTGQDRYEAVFEKSPDAIVIADDEGRFTEGNPAVTELLGVSKDDLLGRRIDEFASEEFDFATAWQEIQEFEQDRGTFPLVRPDGTERIVEYHAVADIMPGQHLSVLRDVTERE